MVADNPPADAQTICGNADASTYFCAQKVALIRLLEKTQTKPDGTTEYFLKPDVGVGLMMFSDVNNKKGGYMRFGVRKMDATNRAALIAVLGKTPGAGLDVSADKANSQENYGLLMWEAFKYFGGGTGTPTTQTGWGPVPSDAGVAPGTRDYSGNGNAKSASTAGATGLAALTGPSTDKNVIRYNPPVSDECGQNYIIAMSHNDSQNDNNNSDAATWFNNVNGGTSSNRVKVGNSEKDVVFTASA